jgi:hypothetical protein
MIVTTFNGDIVVTGTLLAGSFVAPANSVGNSAIRTGDPIGAEKLTQQFPIKLTQVYGAAATAERRVVHVARKAGTILDFYAGVSVAALGDSTVTIKVKKNGADILTGDVVLDSTNLAFASEAQTFSDDDYATGDVLEVAVTVAAGTGTLPQGLFVQMNVRETEV